MRYVASSSNLDQSSTKIRRCSSERRGLLLPCAIKRVEDDTDGEVEHHERDHDREEVKIYAQKGDVCTAVEVPAARLERLGVLVGKAPVEPPCPLDFVGHAPVAPPVGRIEAIPVPLRVTIAVALDPVWVGRVAGILIGAIEIH